MLKVGMVGENPIDTTCVANLLNKKYVSDVILFSIINNINGSDLDNPKTKRLLRIEYEIRKPDIILFIRDLDGLEDNRKMWMERKNYFTEFNSVVDKKGILLINVFELEALLFADLESVSKHYNVEVEPVEDCMKIERPKEYLRTLIRQYDTADNKTLFDLLVYSTVIEKCRYFKKFDEDFDKLIAKKN